MAQQQVSIDVDPDTGIWRTDGLPMIYLPRHFLVNMQKGFEAALGPTASQCASVWLLKGNDAR
ncbi:MAG TPA: DUF5943 domain-containing protein [Falsiroseomonas sp.]|jgi:hypothetical protein|nr:DUF5943 domain-containing protein [Falsiroseomonas sp.]